MAKEHLETTITDRGIGISNDRVEVEIRATGRREDEFEALRDAVNEVLGNDGE